MIKLTYILRRLPTLSLQEFQRYWRQTHGPLVAKHAHTLACRKYIQVHTLEDPLNAAFAKARGLMEPYDGMAELWWNNTEELLQALSTPAGQHASEELREDEHHFIDFAHSAMCFAMEVRGGMDAPFTGHAEAWWDRQELTAALSAPEGLQAFETFAEDERTFIDHTRSAYWVAKEHVFIDR